MPAWRRRAFEVFPALQSELEHHHYTVDTLLSDLLAMAHQAHGWDNRDQATRIYGFAEWCLSQTDQPERQAAATAFYEPLFDDHQNWEAIVPWLSPTVIVDCWPLWEARLEMAELVQIRELLKNRQDHAYRELETS